MIDIADCKIAEVGRIVMFGGPFIGSCTNKRPLEQFPDQHQIVIIRAQRTKCEKTLLYIEVYNTVPYFARCSKICQNGSC